MEVLYPRCCGLDVHKSSITACVLLAQAGKPLKHIRRALGQPNFAVLKSMYRATGGTCSK